MASSKSPIKIVKEVEMERSFEAKLPGATNTLEVLIELLSVISL